MVNDTEKKTTNEELVARIRAEEDPYIRSRLIGDLYQQNQGLIAKCANHFRGYEESDDLMQEGYFGLMIALDMWDPEKGASFATYAFKWIQNSMRRYIHDSGTLIRIPSGQRERIFRYQQTLKDLRKSFNRDPTPGELARALDLSENAIENIKRDAQLLSLRSLSEPIGEDISLEEATPDPDDPISDMIDEDNREELSRLLWAIVDELGEQESSVIRLRYREGLTWEECGARLDRKPGQLKRIEKKCIRTMRQPRYKRQLEPYLEERLSELAYNATGLSSFRRTGMSAEERTLILLDKIREHIEMSKY